MATQAGAMAHLAADRVHTYDTLSRLLTTQYWDTQNWNTASEEVTWYSYDDVGNRISHSHRDAAAIGYGHDKANRMTAAGSNNQLYDDAGNLTLAYSVNGDKSYVYRYDHHNRLTGVYDDTDTTRKAAFVWDALGRREKCRFTLARLAVLSAVRSWVG